MASAPANTNLPLQHWFHLETVGRPVVAIGISLLSSILERSAFFCIYFRLVAAIFDSKHSWTTEDIRTSLILLPDLENVVIDI